MSLGSGAGGGAYKARRGLRAKNYLSTLIRVGQNRIYTYIYTVYLVIFKPKIPYVRRIYMVLANPNSDAFSMQSKR
jgi:hypothetical protein